MPKLFHADPSLSATVDYLRVSQALASRGFSSIIYGGSKGHGFWLQWHGRTIYNSGSSSGNPAFWMCDDAAALCDLTDHELTALHTRDPRLCGETATNDQETQSWMDAHPKSWRSIADYCGMRGYRITEEIKRWMEWYGDDFL